MRRSIYRNWLAVVFSSPALNQSSLNREVSDGFEGFQQKALPDRRCRVGRSGGGNGSAGNQTLTAQSARPETAKPAVVPAGVVAPGARDIMPYGERSRFVTAARTRHTMIGNMDMHRDPNGFDALRH